MNQDKIPQGRGRSKSLSGLDKPSVQGRVRGKSFSARTVSRVAPEGSIKAKTTRTPVLALTAYSQTDKEQYLAKFGNKGHRVLSGRAQALANKVLNWVGDIHLAEEIMALDLSLSEVEQMIELNLPMNDLVNDIKKILRPVLPMLAYSHEDLENYLNNYTDKETAFAALDCFFDFTIAEQIMGLHPTQDEVEKLIQQNMSVADFLALINEPAVTSLTKLLLLVNSPIVDQKTIEDRWQELHDNWESVERTFPTEDAGMNVLLLQTETFWRTPSNTVRQLVRGNLAISKGVLLGFIEQSLEMETRISSLKRLATAYKAVQDNLALVKEKQKEIADLKGNTLTPFTNYQRSELATSAERVAVAGQTGLANTRTTDIDNIDRAIKDDLSDYEHLDLTNSSEIENEVQKQQAHKAQLDAIDVGSIKTPLDNYLAEEDYKNARKYGNLNLTKEAATQAFWKGLTDPQKSNLNTRLAGVTVTDWRVVRFPKRTRSNPNNLRWMVVPVLANLNLNIGPEVVYDWAYQNKQDHGNTDARKLIDLVNKGLNRQPLKYGLFVCDFDDDGHHRDPETYSWKNNQTFFVVKNNTLITYFIKS